MSLLTQSALLRALGWSLFNSLWQMSLLWAFFHFFLLLFKDIPARSRHGLALLLLTVGAGWSVLGFFEAWLSPDSLPQASQWLSIFLPSPHVRLTLERTGSWLVGQALPWFSSLYLLILFGLLVRYGHQYLQSRRLTRSGLTPISPEFRVFVTATARQMGIRTGVGVWLSAFVDVPVTLGFLKPVILVPLAMLTNLSTRQAEAILVHELAHIRRKDYLLNLGVTIVELLFFFNPFTRMLAGYVKKEREHCCDDQVLQFRYDPHAYVSALLSLARQSKAGSFAVAAVGSGNALLLQRAKKILRQKGHDDRLGPRPLILFFLTLVLTLLSIGASRPGNKGPDPLKGGFLRQPGVTDATLTGLRFGVVRNELASTSTPMVSHAPLAARTGTAANHRHGAPRHTVRPATWNVSPAAPALTDAEDGNAIAVLPAAGPADASTTSFADLVQAQKRDYSMGKSGVMTVTPAADAMTTEEDYPFVPQSSFSFQYTDTIPPMEKLAWLQGVSEKDFHVAIRAFHFAVRAQLKSLHEQQAAAQKSLAGKMRGDLSDKAREQALGEFLKKQGRLQQQYLRRLDDLQRNLLKMGHRLTIVYI